MRNKATKKNMDLDLRRYGNKLYSKAEKSGGSNDGEEGGSSNSIIEAIKNLHVYLTEDGAKKVTNSGTVNFNNGIKDSFRSDNWPSDDWVSVPIEDYLYVSDINALKALLEILYSHVWGKYNNSNCCIYDITKQTPYLNNGSTSANCIASTEDVYQQEEPYDLIGYSIFIYYTESGQGSTFYPTMTLRIDPNDCTKALVSPNDL